MSTEIYLSIREFSARAGVSEAAVYKRIRAGKLHPIKNGELPRGRLILPVSDLSAFIARPEKTRRIIMTSPELDRFIDSNLSTYGDISSLFEEGAWVMFILRGIVTLEQSVEYLSTETIHRLSDLFHK